MPNTGLDEKNPNGIKEKPMWCTGITGQSSGLTICVRPATYHSTISLLPVALFFEAHSGNPSYTLLLAGYLPAGNISSSAYCVTHTWWFKKPAFFLSNELSSTNGFACSPGISI